MGSARKKGDRGGEVGDEAFTPSAFASTCGNRPTAKPDRWLAMEHGIEREREALHRGMSLRPSPIRGGGRAALCRSLLLYRYCTDCQKASGSAFIPFMGFASSAVRFNGRARRAERAD